MLMLPYLYTVSYSDDITLLIALMFNKDPGELIYPV